MIMDELLEFCDATDVSASTGTALAGDVVDLGTGRDLGRFKDCYLVIDVTTTFTSGTSSTVIFKLASDAAAAIATDGSATEHVISETYAHTALTAGTRLVFPLPLEGNVYERYVGLLVVTGSAATTAGSINAFLHHGAVPGWKALANGADYT